MKALILCVSLVFASCASQETMDAKARKMDDSQLRRGYYSAVGNIYLPRNTPALLAYEKEMEARKLMPPARR